jgi:hypothetical protein
MQLSKCAPGCKLGGGSPATPMPETPNPPPSAEEGRTPWGRIYAAVILSAVAVMLALWAFSRAFTP